MVQYVLKQIAFTFLGLAVFRQIASSLKKFLAMTALIIHPPRNNRQSKCHCEVRSNLFQIGILSFFSLAVCGQIASAPCLRLAMTEEQQIASSLEQLLVMTVTFGQITVNVK